MKKKILILITLLTLTISGISITSKADEVYVYNDVLYQEYPITTMKLGADVPNLGEFIVDIDIQKPCISIEQDYTIKYEERTLTTYNEDIFSGLTYGYIDVPMAITSTHTTIMNAWTTYNELCYTINSCEFIYDKPFVLVRGVDDVMDFNGVGVDSNFHTIESILITITLLEYKYIDNEYKIIPILEEFEIYNVVEVGTNDIWEYLNDKYNKTKFVIQRMSIFYTLEYNGTTSGECFFYNISRYYNYDNYIIMPNWINELNNQVTIAPVEYDYTNWLITAVGGFMDFEIAPGFSIGGLLGIILSVTLLMYILKMFLGG